MGRTNNTYAGPTQFERPCLVEASKSELFEGPSLGSEPWDGTDGLGRKFDRRGVAKTGRSGWG
jgi:hypothetical protein